MSGLDFDVIRSAALAQAELLLQDWFPAGKRVGHEYVVGSLAGEPGRSLSVSLRTGKWADFGGAPAATI